MGVRNFKMGVRNFEITARNFEITASDFETGVRNFEMGVRNFEIGASDFKTNRRNSKTNRRRSPCADGMPRQEDGRVPSPVGRSLSALTRILLIIMDIQRELDRLPARLDLPAPPDTPAAPDAAPLSVLARQGRNLMKLGMATETLTTQIAALSGHLTERDAQIEILQDTAKRQARQELDTAKAAIHLMDALDWIHDSLRQNGQADFADEVAVALRDCLRTLASVGINEIPAEGLLDGRLHEALDTVESDTVPRYHIVRIVRRGYQRGTEILRPAEVITAR